MLLISCGSENTKCDLPVSGANNVRHLPENPRRDNVCYCRNGPNEDCESGMDLPEKYTEERPVECHWKSASNGRTTRREVGGLRL